MTERIVFRQNKNFEVEFLASDPRTPEDLEVEPVQGLHEITPYGMMLFSLASCTAQVVLTYANHHGIPLEETAFDVIYERVFEDDCENCQEINRYQEKIKETMEFAGELTDEEEQKLFRIAHQCPLEKMYKEGIKIESELRT